jgi:hypothetical protein
MKDTIRTVLAEFEGLYKELGLNNQEMILNSLCNLRDNIVQAHNVLDIKEEYARENLKHLYTCIYVEEYSVFVIVVTSWITAETTISIDGDTISFYVKGQKPFDVNTDDVIIGVTEQLAWCNAYNKLLAIERKVSK